MNQSTVILRVCPMGKPRMTQRDRWKKRDVVLRYHAFKDRLREHLDDLPEFRALVASGEIEQLSWRAYLPMPPSWSKKKQVQMAGTLHRAKPDRDNIDKAILDALFTEDSGIACGTLEKRWDDGDGPRIEITVTTSPIPSPVAVTKPLRTSAQKKTPVIKRSASPKSASQQTLFPI